MIKFLKFSISGFLTYGINIGLTMFLIEKMGFQKKSSYFISILIITVINFLVSLKFVFKKSFKMDIFLKYIFFLLFFSTINYLSVLFISGLFTKNIFYVIIFLVTSFIFFIKFIVYDKYVFGVNKIDESEF